jgi:hydroxypyruvate reductase
VPDSSSFSSAERVFKKYGISKRVPISVQERIERGIKGEIEETPKPGDPAFRNSHCELVGTNLQALLAAAEEAKLQGYRTLILSAQIEGETREVAKAHAGIAKEVLASGHPIAPPACILSGGETTVTLAGDGLGGRNQEFVLAAAIALDGMDRVLVLSGGTDGNDGPTDAAGALADGATLERAREKGLDPLDYLQRNDSYPFFEKLGDLLMTGPTRTNVMDVRVLLLEKG